jgi:molybdopterin-synthase adenylyltransferase
VKGRAAIVGVGGLGAPAAAALAWAGATSLTLFDGDLVELSNLPRQPLFGTSDVGRRKVEAARERLRARHPHLRVEARCMRLDDGSARRELAGHDVILDGSDNLATKVLLNEVALALGVPLVHAGAVGLEGQLMTILPQESACLRCLFVDLPQADDLPSCQEAGILGPVVGALGLAAAREAVSVLCGRRPRLADRLAILAGRTLAWRAIELRANPRCPSCRAARSSTTSMRR